MAVEQMKLVNFVGQLGQYDRIVRQYVIESDIHLENAQRVLSSARGIYPFGDSGNGDAFYKRAQLLGEQLGIEGAHEAAELMTQEAVASALTEWEERLKPLGEERERLRAQAAENEEIKKQLLPIKGVDIRLDELFAFRSIKVRFGKLPVDSYVKLDTYMEEMNTLFFLLDRDEEWVFGVYFTTEEEHELVDSVYSSLYFERIILSHKISGKPAEALAAIEGEQEEIEKAEQALAQKLIEIKEEKKADFLRMYASAWYYSRAEAVRRKAAHTKEYFYVTGWMAEEEARRLSERMAGEEGVSLIIEEPEMVHHMRPPTRLRNPKFLKPFESFVAMYGLPDYREVDPTPFFALTYTLLFGMMYGDMGHGLLLLLAGLLIGKRSFLGGILKTVGISAMVFGALYGEIFGIEYAILGGWRLISPMHSMMTMLLAAVVMGVLIITAAMLFNIINGVRLKEYGRLWFGSGGVAGLVFYWAVLMAVLSVLSGKSLRTGYILGLIVVPLILIFLQEPLSKLLARRKDWMPEKKGMFLTESFFEMFEVLLSYVTNSVSFIRVGAFALIHAGMMMVVMQFVEQTSGGASIAVFILGNLLIAGLEGLLVAIQVLRLEFYELFSRYYRGGGRAFESQKEE